MKPYQHRYYLRSKLKRLGLPIPPELQLMPNTGGPGGKRKPYVNEKVERRRRQWREYRERKKRQSHDACPGLSTASLSGFSISYV